MPFPKNFFWGASTASYQVEGGIDNCDWADAAVQKKVPPCGQACDHYHLYEKDFDLAQSIGHTCHRFSVEWARVEPREGYFDEHEIEHYVEVVRALRKRGMEPFATLWHFTLPSWFVKRGGWLAKDSHELFARYCAKIVEALRDDCHHFATMNEPLVYVSQGWLGGHWPPFKRNRLIASYRVAKRLIAAHREAYCECKVVCPSCDISLVKHNIYFHANPRRNFFVRIWNRIRAAVSNYVWNRWFLDSVMGCTDVIGLNFYRHHEYGATEQYPVSDMGWELYPQGLRYLLTDLKRYELPLYVAEAGIADADDDQRASYIRGLIKATGQAMEDGADVRGFMYWSLLDNYEWSFGFSKRFGLIEIDYETLERTIRRSAYEYKKIIETDGILEG